MGFAARAPRVGLIAGGDFERFRSVGAAPEDANEEGAEGGEAGGYDGCGGLGGGPDGGGDVVVWGGGRVSACG